MTDKELRDAAVAELKLTTAGWRKPNGNPNYPSGVAPITSHWGKAMKSLEQIGQPPATGFPVPTYELRQAAGSGPHGLWILHTSPTTPSLPWYPGGPLIRHLVWGTSYEWWCLFQIVIPSGYSVADEGANYALPVDLHAVGGEPGWTTVSCTHIRFEKNTFILQHQPNKPGQHEWVFGTNPERDVKHSIAAHFIFGRLDGTVPATGHPNSGKGRTRIALDGQWVLNTGDISNITRENNVNATRVQVLEGHYSHGNTSALVSRMTAQRWGRTREEALGDSGILRTASQLGGSSFTTISPWSSSDFVAPP